MAVQAAKVRDDTGFRYFYVAADDQAGAAQLLLGAHPDLNLADVTWGQLENDVFGMELESGGVLEWIVVRVGRKSSKS
jgi:hypothetical protein